MPFSRNPESLHGIPYPFASDLLEINLQQQKDPGKATRLFKVLSDVLSDLGIYTGDILTMCSAASDDRPPPYAIVAVHLTWTGTLLLRQFIPPRLLITNSSRIAHPHLQARRWMKIVARLDHT